MTWFWPLNTTYLYLPHRPDHAVCDTFIGCNVIFKVVTGLIKLIPFL